MFVTLSHRPNASRCRNLTRVGPPPRPPQLRRTARPFPSCPTSRGPTYNDGEKGLRSPRVVCMPAFRPSLLADRRPLTPDVVATIIAELTGPAHFFVREPLRLAWQHR